MVLKGSPTVDFEEVDDEVVDDEVVDDEEVVLKGLPQSVF